MDTLLKLIAFRQVAAQVIKVLLLVGCLLVLAVGNEFGEVILAVPVVYLLALHLGHHVYF